MTSTIPRCIACARIAAAAFACALACVPPALAAPSARAVEARALEHGEGVPRNPLRAAALYCEAAKEGDADAAWALGWMLANGRGIPRDDARAAALFQWAAQWDHPQAKQMLSMMRSVTPDVPDCLRPKTDPVAWGPFLPYAEPLVLMEGSPVPEGDPFADLPKWKQQVADLVGKLAPRFGIDPRLALSVIAVESNFDAQAVSPKDARGLMQLIPQTAARFNVRNPFDPRQNVLGGLQYLSYLLAYYRGDVVLAAAAYNAGEKAVDRHRGVPPFEETQAYVRKVLALYPRMQHPFEANRAPEPSSLVGLRH
jgi:soluble lytic murein transglycosylase-like protein